MHYTIIAQSADEVREVSNAPAISIPAYLVQHGEEHQLRVISVYAKRGETASDVRILYMNEAALTTWRAMDKTPTVIGVCHRPPKDALLSFGVPFSS